MKITHLCKYGCSLWLLINTLACGGFGTNEALFSKEEGKDRGYKAFKEESGASQPVAPPSPRPGTPPKPDTKSQQPSTTPKDRKGGTPQTSGAADQTKAWEEEVLGLQGTWNMIKDLNPNKSSELVKDLLGKAQRLTQKGLETGRDVTELLNIQTALQTSTASPRRELVVKDLNTAGVDWKAAKMNIFCFRGFQAPSSHTYTLKTHLGRAFPGASIFDPIQDRKQTIDMNSAERAKAIWAQEHVRNAIQRGYPNYPWGGSQGAHVAIALRAILEEERKSNRKIGPVPLTVTVAGAIQGAPIVDELINANDELNILGTLGKAIPALGNLVDPVRQGRKGAIALATYGEDVKNTENYLALSSSPVVCITADMGKGNLEGIVKRAMPTPTNTGSPFGDFLFAAAREAMNHVVLNSGLTKPICDDQGRTDGLLPTASQAPKYKYDHVKVHNIKGVAHEGFLGLESVFENEEMCKKVVDSFKKAHIEYLRSESKSKK